MIRTFGKWLGRILLMLLLAGALTGWMKREELMRLAAVNTIFEPDKVVENFSHMDRAFLTAPLPVKEATASPLPERDAIMLPDGMTEWLNARRATSLVVLKDGALAYEDYYLQTSDRDLRIGWSLSKSMLSALTGILVAEGKISGLDDPVTQYVPRLEGTAYEGVSIRNVLNMATGVTFDEDYLEYHSDINRMGRVLALGGLMDDFAGSLTERFTQPGVDYQYVSIDTHVLGMVIRNATGKTVTELMGRRIFSPLGVERTPYYLTDGSGVAFVLGGINMTSRDFARFGQMVAQRGMWQGQEIVPHDWIMASTEPSAPTDPDEYSYGYKWWMAPDARPREFLGRGIYGQYLYINETQGVVIVLTAVDPSFRDRHIQDEHVDWFRLIADSLEED